MKIKRGSPSSRAEEQAEYPPTLSPTEDIVTVEILQAAFPFRRAGRGLGYLWEEKSFPEKGSLWKRKRGQGRENNNMGVPQTETPHAHTPLLL